MTKKDKQTAQFKQFKRIFFSKMNTNEFKIDSDYCFGKLEAIFDKMTLIPCKEHGLEKKSYFSTDSIDVFKTKFIEQVIKHKDINKVWMSGFQYCNTSGPKDNTNAVYCYNCHTRDSKKFSNNGKLNGKVECNLCKAIRIEDTVAVYENHLKQCGLDEFDMRAHKQYLNNVENIPKKLNVKLDPYATSDDDDGDDGYY